MSARSFAKTKFTEMLEIIIARKNEEKRGFKLHKIKNFNKKFLHY